MRRRFASGLSIACLTSTLLVFDVVPLPSLPEGAVEARDARVQTLSISAAGEVTDADATSAPTAASVLEPAPSVAPSVELAPSVAPSAALAPDSAPSAPAELLATGVDAAVVTDEIETDDFAVLGVTWQPTGGDEQVSVEVRVREDAGWTDWTTLETNDSGPDMGTQEYEDAADIMATEPLIAADADALQVRVHTADGEAPQDLETVLIDPGTGSADGVTSDTSVLSGADAAVVRPAITRRAQWGAKATRCSSNNYSDTVLAATVHHTAGSNNYTAAQSAGILRGIQSYHMDTLGWCDVGYQFVVDKYGQIFEGRAGGIDRPVVGAHAGGFNSRTFGVSALGNYETASTTPALVAAISRVIGWKLSLYERDIYGSATLTSAGGGTAKYAEGTSVTLPNVFGHRDVGNTSCPGRNLYSALGSIRSQAAAYQSANQEVAGGDLYAITNNGASGKVELHADSRASSFRSRMLSVASGLAGKDPGRWRFFVGSLNGDSRPDLIAVQTSGTPSGKVEVEVYSWASNYRSRALDVTTPLAAFVADDRWQMDIASSADGQADLVFVDTRGAGGTMDLHVLSAASGYQTWVVQKSTALQSGYGRGEVKLLMDDNRDLWLIKHAGTTGTGQMEMHVVTASSDYKTFSLHRGVPAELGPLTKWAFATGDYTGDKKQDMYLLKVDQTGSGRSEVHVLSGASLYRTFVLHRATTLPQLPYPSWQVSIG